MASRVILFLDTSPLLLGRVKRCREGKVVSGFVENGCWWFEMRGDECLAKDSNDRVISRWGKPEGVSEFKVPSNWVGDYNEVITRAREMKQNREYSTMEVESGQESGA